MKYKYLNLNQDGRIGNRTIYSVMLLGFLLRAALLILMLALKNVYSPYFLSDDIAYEVRAQSYLLNANGIVDLDYLEYLLRGYMQPFWPVVMCISARLFCTIYAGRAINICLSTACVFVIYQTVLLLTPSEKTALRAAKLFAFLPVTVITSCFPIKDIYLTWAVLYAFYVFLLVHFKKPVKIAHIMVTVLGLIGAYFARGAVAELMGIFFVLLWLDSLCKRKRYKAVIAVLALALVVLVLYGNTIIQTFLTKIEDYGGYNERSTGMLSMLQMKKPWEFYKLVPAYFFATLQPMTLNYYAVPDKIWMWLLRIGNISLYPVAIANFLYIFQRKHNRLYWFCGVVIYCAVISMCLGIFRHYLFLISLEMINCALMFDRRKRKTKRIVVFGTIGMVMFMALYSLATGL